MAKKKMILDLDTGVDDALALAYAVADPEVDLIGIVASYGNNLLDVCAENSLKLLELLGQTDVPVYKGLPHSSTTDSFEVMQVSKDIHGNNGIGDVELPTPKRAVEAESGVDFYIDAYYNLDIDKNGCALHDPLAVGVSIDPTFVQTISLFMKVDYEEHNYGRTIGDNSRLNDPNPNVKVAVNVDKERYLKVFMERLNSILKEH